MYTISLKHCFLLTLASGRWRSELHTLGVSDGLVKLSKTEVILRTTPGFLAKTQAAGSIAAPISIKALINLTGSDPQEVALCPVRAIHIYPAQSPGGTEICVFSFPYHHPKNQTAPQLIFPIGL